MNVSSNLVSSPPPSVDGGGDGKDVEGDVKGDGKTEMQRAYESSEAFGDRWLWKQTDADKGFIEHPRFLPCVRLSPFGEGLEGLYVSSSTRNTVLFGKLYALLGDAIDGTTSLDALCEKFADTHTSIQVRSAVVSLAYKGVLVSADYDMSDESAILWSFAGASPRAALELLAEPIGVASFCEDADALPALIASLERFGFRCVDASEAGESSLSLYLADSYHDSRFASVNAEHVKSGRRWLPIARGGMERLAGPVAGGEGACWECVAFRLRNNQDVASMLREREESGSFLLPTDRLGLFNDEFWSQIGLALLHLRVYESRAALAEGLFHSPAGGWGGDAGYEKVFRRPQCSACGDATLSDPSRPPEPVRLRESVPTVFTSGGIRAKSPGETFNAYKHLIAERTGVVRGLDRYKNEFIPVDPSGEWLNVYTAGQNLAVGNRNYHLLRTSLRSRSAGKGRSDLQAKVSAVCESIERYSGVYHGDERRVSRRFSDFAAGEAMAPNDLMLFSERQLEHRDQINAMRRRFVWVPRVFDPEERLDWTPAWSLSDERPVHFLTHQMYYAAPFEGESQRGELVAAPDSNGCASGSSLEDAAVQGFYELVERDAYAMWWYSRYQVPEVDLDSFGDPFLSKAKAYYAHYGLKLWMIDITNDFGIPVFASVAYRPDAEYEGIITAAGAHHDPYVAALRCVCEMNQYLTAVRDLRDDGGFYYDDEESNWFWRNVKMKDMSYLIPDPSAEIVTRDRYETPTDDAGKLLRVILDAVHARGLKMMILDQTRPDVGMPVVKTIVPGMRHFWARFGAGRLYDVPFAMGRVASPLKEEELNPIAVFI